MSHSHWTDPESPSLEILARAPGAPDRSTRRDAADPVTLVEILGGRPPVDPEFAPTEGLGGVVLEIVEGRRRQEEEALRQQAAEAARREARSRRPYDAD